MIILSMEASTSSAKAMLYDSEHGVLGIKSIPYGVDISDGITFSPDGVIDMVLTCGALLVERFPGMIVEAVGLSSVWHSLILLDDDYKPIGRGRTWADISSAPTAALYRKDAERAKLVYHATGCPLHSTYNVCKWLHLKRTEDISNVRYVSSLPEYLFYTLTGELAISQSAASGMGFLSTHTLDWDSDLLELAGIGRENLGRLVEPQYSLPLVPTSASRLGQPAGISVVVCGPDGALNHIAAGGLGSGVMTLSVGTSGAVRIAHLGPVIPEKQSTWCYYCAEGFHLVGAATAGAGNCVNWFVKDLMGGSISYHELETSEDATDRTIIPYFLPFLFGERCPGWDDERLGGFCSLGHEARPGGLYRAVLEGVLFNLYQNYLILVENIGNRPGKISISGGITQSPLWTRMATDIFGFELIENTGEHASLLGAAYMALRVMNHIPSLRSIPVEYGTVHEPNIERHEMFMERFMNWMNFYRQYG
jgi:gluconokinase